MRKKHRILLAALFLIAVLPLIGAAEEIPPPRGDRIAEHCFPLQLPHFGKTEFASFMTSEGVNRLEFYLIKNDVPLYKFPECYGNAQNWYAFELKAVAFRDLNNDGLKDVIVVADYITGIGPDGAKPFPVVAVYLNRGNRFDNDPELNGELNADWSVQTVAGVERYFREHPVK
jgi:hypothetical protein